ncbi:MAG: LysR substrate-binding domain-containing protein [Gammaproteobacteria bacterium]
MTLTELRYIVAVARERHFGRAAEACFVSQPTLSVAVRKLEDELGVVLFERGPSEVTVTPVGERIIAQAMRVLDEARTLKELAKQGQDPLSGPIRLGAIYTIAPYLLPHLIPVLHKCAPHMPLLIEENYTGTLAGRLQQGELDVIVISLPFEESGIVTQPLYDEDFVVVLPVGHPLAKKTAVKPTDITDETVLLLGAGHCFRDQVLSACPACNRSSAAPGSLQKTLEGSSLETIRLMVASGVGITVLPGTSVSTRHNKLLAVRPFVKPVPTRRVALAWRKSFTRPEAIQAIRQAILSSDLPGIRPIM